MGTVAASDTDTGDTLTYSLAATDDHADFDIVSGTGELTLQQAADYEDKVSYTITVNVTDGKNAVGNPDTSIDATIEVTDVDEPPTVTPGSVTVNSAPEGLDVSWTAPTVGDMTGKPPVNGYDVQYRISTGSNTWGQWQDHTHTSVDVSTQIRGLTVGVTYGVQVRAKNDEGDGPYSAPATGVPDAALPPPTVNVDYDGDGDGLIDVNTLAQLNAMRWDLDGNGVSTNAGYALAFPAPAPGMGCKLTDHDSTPGTPDQPTCTGYELEADLDFDQNNDDTITSIDAAWWDGGYGWDPIGSDANTLNSERYNAIFEGNGHTISNLFIDRTANDVGLFGSTGTSSEVRMVGLEGVNVTGLSYTGALVGSAYGDIRSTYTTGSVVGVGGVGGLVGYGAHIEIRLSYSNAAVTASSNEIGGLVGSSTSVSIVAGYATGAVSGTTKVGGLAGYLTDSSVVASYATGVVTGTSELGGLVGDADNSPATNSYWDTTTSGQAASPGGGVGKTTSQLQTPMAYGSGSDIYAAWNVDLDDADDDNDRITNPDDPWDFGTASQYPALKEDFDDDGRPTAGEFGRQVRSAPAVDYDTDDDNLIDVNTLAQLNAMRWDLDGNGVSTNAGYALAFPAPAPGMGCKPTDHDNDAATPDQPTCTGYELEANLDFDQNNDDTITSIDAAWWNGGSGWEPIGSDSSTSTRYNTVFEGNGHTISHLFINRAATDNVGLFGATGTGSEVRMVGLVDANVTGRDYVGGLVGSAYGDIRSAYTTGSVTGRNSVGGLAGKGTRIDIRLSYSNAAVTGSTNRAGGLAGYLISSSVVAGYATGAVAATPGGQAGGLAGYLSGSSVVASYATGAVTGTVSLGGLVGISLWGSTVTNSYWDTQTSGQANSAGGGAGKTTSDLQTPTAYGSGSDIYAAWNVDVDDADGDNSLTSGTDDPWGFGTSNQYPALKADFDGDGRPTAYEFGRQGRAAPPPPPANEQPTFDEEATATRSVAENTAAGADIGNPFTAADPDVGDTVTYSLGTTADDGHFAIVAASGQLQTKDPLDYESNTSYSVTVTATDGDGLTDSITVTINVTDVDETSGTS